MVRRAIETVVARDGGRTVVQMAYDSAGRLVHYDPKYHDMTARSIVLRGFVRGESEWEALRAVGATIELDADRLQLEESWDAPVYEATPTDKEVGPVTWSPDGRQLAGIYDPPHSDPNEEAKSEIWLFDLDKLVDRR